jgi:hypothetical protein
VTAAPLTEFAPEETVEATEDSPASALDETESNFLAEPPFEFDEEELTSNAFERLGEEELSAREDEDSEDSESDSAAPSEITAEPEEDADASHRIDPSAPSGFKLFGFGKKKKDSETAAGTKTSAPAAPVSTYAPGNGVVEEEVIEGEELRRATPHARRHKPEVHDTGRLRRRDAAEPPPHRRPGRNVPGGPSRPPHPDGTLTTGGVEEDESRRKRRRSLDGSQPVRRPRNARSRRPGDSVAAARRAIGADHRAVRLRPQTCRSSPTC